jgi:hypothetical protein
MLDEVKRTHSFFVFIYMKSLVASALIFISSLCAQALAQPAATSAPAAQQNLQNSQAPEKTQKDQPTLTRQLPSTASKVNRDNWDCSLYATRYDWWRFELVITTLSTYRLQDCSPDGMSSITVASATAQLKPVATFDTVLKGGANQMLMDINLTPVVNEYYWVSNLKFSALGETRINLYKLYQTTKLKSTRNLAGASYVPFTIRGESHFIWNAGTLVHRLVAPNGDSYIMYSYTKEVQPSLNRENLSNIDQLLRMPAGWTYENYFLDKTVVVRAGVENDSSVTVIFDDLNNYYVLYDQ